MQNYYNLESMEYDSLRGKAMMMTKGGDRCPSPPKHGSFLHKETYEAYNGGHAKHGHDGFTAHQSETWIEKEKHHDGGWGGHHGHSPYGGGWGGHSQQGGGWGGHHSGHSHPGGGYGYAAGGGSGYGQRYESYPSMGGGPLKGTPLWNFKGIQE